MFKTVAFLFALFHLGQQQNFATISQNFCNNLSGGALPDNLSCPDNPVEQGMCFLRAELCDGGNDCGDGTTGSDEGDNSLFSSLECATPRSDSMFDCGFGVLIPLEQLCDGVDNCANSARPGDDETAAICDNKCLAPYYGNCSQSRECENSRNGVNCGSCFTGVDVVTQIECGTLTVGSATFTEGVDSQVQVCADLFYPSIGSQTLNTPGTVVFAPGTATGPDYIQTTQTLTFMNGLSTTGVTIQQCVMFTIVDDNILEPNEIFTIEVTVGGFTASGTISIIDNDEPIFAFSPIVFNVVEGTDVSGSVIIANNVNPGTTVSVTCNVIPGSASAADFGTHSAVIVNFPAGTSTVPFTVQTEDDMIIEDSEQFTLTLSNPSMGSVSMTSGTAMVTITDNDIPVFGFEPTMYSEVEPAVNSSFTATIIETTGLTFAPGVTRSVTLNTQTTGPGITQPATSGVDFTPIVGSVLNIGFEPFPVTYTLLADESAEPDEMFNLVLTAGGGATIAPGAATATVQITDNDMLVFQFAANPVTVQENMGPAMVCVNLVSGSPSAAVSLSLNPSPGTAMSPEDFIDTTMTVTFAANSLPGTQQCANFVIVDNNVMEPQETFSVMGSGGMFQGGQTTTTVVINDNDMPIFEFVQQVFPVAEQNGPAIAQLRLAAGSAALGSAISLSVSTQPGGSALAFASGNDPQDFTTTSTTIMFPAGSQPLTTMPFTVPINDDTFVENIEAIPLLATVVGGPTVATFTPGGNMATIEIASDDALQVGFQLQTYSMLEENDQMVCLTNTGTTMLAPGVSVSATVGTLPGTAIAPDDYDATPSPSMVTFTPENPIQCVTLDIVNDNVDEPDEQFQVTATPSAGQIVIPDPSSDVIIGNDDLILAQFNVSRVIVNEGTLTGVEVCVDITGGVVGSTGVVINVMDVSGGDATVGMDFNAINAVLNFAPFTSPGSATDQECFIFFPINDILVEDPEEIIIELSSPNPVVVFTQSGSQGIIEIMDDDQVSVMIVPPIGQPPNQPPDFMVPENGGPLEVCVMVVSGGVAVLGRPVSVILSTMDGTAIGAAPGALADFCTESFTIVIPPGQENMIFCNNITINNDNICEGDEDFSLVLESGPDGGTMITNSPGTATIVDDDVAEITATYDISVPENIGELKISVILLGQKAPGRVCNVTASTMDGTAVSGMPMNNDFVGGSQSVILDADNQVEYIMFEILDDGICEGLETFQIYLSTMSPGCRIQNGTSPITVEILDDEIGSGGDDPHFSIVLPSGRLLCYTVQGEHGFSFNLISNKKMTMNARFVPDSRRNEVTWMGSMGIVVRDSVYKQSNATALRFEAIKKKVYIGDKVELAAKNIERMTFKNGKLIISEAPPTDKFKYPSIYVDLQDVEISFTMKFLAEHLDIFWHRTGGKIPDSHGIIGQFFRTGVEIDEVRKILIMPNKEPVPVMRRPVWSFMEREKADDQLCWTAMNPGYQGEGLIDGTYFDYLVDDVMTSEFEFKKKQ